MAALTTQQISRAGTAPTYAAVSASDTVECGKDIFLHVKNAGGSSDTVTLTIPAGRVWYANVTTANPTVSVPATTGDRMIGPILPELFADSAAAGLATITHSFTTSVTIAVLKLQEP